MAFCGVNYCLLASDKRVTFRNNTDHIEVDDSFEKIFKVNDNVIFGGTGSFWGNEDVYEPIKSRMNDRLSIVDAVKMTEQFMYDNLVYVSLMKRNYFITGKDEDDIYYLVRVSLNEEERSVQTISYVPKDLKQNATMLVLPHSLGDIRQAKKYNKMLNDSVKIASVLPDIYLGCSKIILSVSNDDPSYIVGDKLSFLSIHD